MNKKIKTIGFLLLLFCFSAKVYAEANSTAVSTPEHQKSLLELKSKAEALCAKNLNRFGLEVLKDYNKMLDTIFVREKTDTLAAINAAYARNFNKRKTDSGDLKSQFDDLNTTKDVYAAKYHGLLRKSGIAFAAWLLIILVILKWRKNLLRKSQLALDANTAQLSSTEQNFSSGEELFKSTDEWNKKITAMSPLISQIQKSVTTLSEKASPEISSSDALKTILKNSSLIQANTNRLANLSNAIIEQHNEQGKEKKLTNINLLCDQYSDLAFNGFIEEEGPQYQLTKDFEKNLPAIKIVPEAVGSLLLYVLDNAFMSVSAKHKKVIKGYTPKVSISTRILPRFVQVRIKDNGDGFADEALEKVYEAFHSGDSNSESAGLGLHFSDRIIKENNGEIKIESEKGNGTDVYIKFFLHSDAK